MRRPFNLAALFLAAVINVWAQEYRASISGTITDPTGAIVADAAVTVTDVLKNTKSDAKTNEAGYYSIPFLLPSKYQITVQAAGFKRFAREDVVLGVNDRIAVDVTLEVGALSESVTVSGQFGILQTETASRGGAVEQRLVEDLPNNGRNMFQIVFMMPGVYKPSTSQGNSFDIGSGIGNANPSINGTSQGVSGRSWNTEVLVDGVADNRATKDIVTVPALESVQEMQVLTNMYDSSYGHTGGGVVSIVTKSGTNALHGVVFNRTYDAKWRANTWVENFNNRIKPPSRLYNYGFQANGPVYVPKVFNGRNKLFFMLSWDKSPRDAPFNAQFSTVPTDAMKSGDFSALRGAGGQPVVVYDPLTTQLDASGRYLRTPFAGNRIPANRFDPVGAKILSYFPSPNSPGGGVSGLERNLLATGVQHDMTAQWAGRLDLRLNEKHSLSGRFTVTDQHRDGQNRFGPASPAEPERSQRGDGGRQMSLDWTAVINPTMTWDLRLGFARFEETAGSALSAAFDPTELGYPASLVNQFATRNYPQINFGFYQAHGTDQVKHLAASDTYTLQPTLGKVYRSHIMKLGAEFRDYRFNRLDQGGANAGNLAFARSWTQANALQADAFSGDEIATALLGYPGGSFLIPAPPSYSYHYYVLYFQDDWKVTRKLALNLGLRWDYESPAVERFNQQMRGFAFDQPSPIAAQAKSAAGAANCAACADLRGGPLFAGANGKPRAAFEPSYKHFQPRVGVAYALNAKTVLRGGYGIYYMAIDLNSDVGSSDGFSRTTPIVTSTDGNLTPAVRISNPLAGGSLLRPVGSSLGLATNLGLGLTANYLDRGLPRSHQVSFGIQRLMPLAITLDASYVGNYSTRLPVSLGLNFIPASQFGQASSFYTTQVTNPFQGLLPNNAALNGANIPRQQLLFAYPQYSALNLGVVPIGKNRHDSVQVTARRRFGSGLTFQVNYVISKTLEQLQFLNQQDINLSDYFQSRLDKRLTPFDVPQRLSFIGVYDLPIGKGRKYATSLPWVANLFLGGWTLGWTATYQSGFPIDFPNAAPLDQRSARLSSDTRNVFRWFDTSLFPKVAGPAPFTLRTFPSRFPDVRFMDFQSWDFNLSKDIPFHEKLKGQVRVTSINAFNHPYMTQLASNNVTSTQFGQLALAQNNPSRTFYIDFRLVF